MIKQEWEFESVGLCVVKGDRLFMFFWLLWFLC